MSINFDRALGIHEKALGFRAQRAEVLANNIANADTPHYKARLDFASVLSAQADQHALKQPLVQRSIVSILTLSRCSWLIRRCVFVIRIMHPLIKIRLICRLNSPLMQKCAAVSSQFHTIKQQVQGLMTALRGD